MALEFLNDLCKLLLYCSDRVPDLIIVWFHFSPSSFLTFIFSFFLLKESHYLRFDAIAQLVIAAIHGALEALSVLLRLYRHLLLTEVNWWRVLWARHIFQGWLTLCYKHGHMILLLVYRYFWLRLSSHHYSGLHWKLGSKLCLALVDHLLVMLDNCRVLVLD